MCILIFCYIIKTVNNFLGEKIMTEGTISLIVIAAFLLVLVTGFLIGLGRGFNKSLVRILLMVASIVGAFFLTPVITNGIMNMNISGLGIHIGSDPEPIANLTELCRALLNQVPAIQDISGTEAFNTIMTVVPQMIGNIVMFILLFYIIRLVTLIIYWIIAGIAFSKKKTEDKNKHRLLGSLVGTIQNFLVFVVLLIPVYGSISLVAQVETIITQETESSTTATTLDEGENYSVLMTTTEEAENAVVTALAKVNEVVDVCKNTWVMKMLGGIKVDVLCEKVFDSLSTVEKDGEKYVLKDEISTVATLYVDYKDLSAAGFDITNDDSVKALKNIVNHCFNSKLTANLINEVVPLAVTEWNAGRPFAGINKPHIEGFDNVVTDLLEELATAARNNKLQSVLASSLDMAKSVMKAAQTMQEAAGNIDAETIGDLLNTLTEDPVLIEIAKTVVVDHIDEIVEQVFGEEDTNGYGAALSEVVDTIFSIDFDAEDAPEVAGEIAVVTEALEFVQSIGESGEAPDQETVNSLVETLNDSTVIFDMLTSTDEETGENNSKVAEVVRDAMAADPVVETQVKDYLKTAINELSAGEEATPEEEAALQARKEALAPAFGVDLDSLLP